MTTVVVETKVMTKGMMESPSDENLSQRPLPETSAPLEVCRDSIAIKTEGVEDELLEIQPTEMGA